MSNVDSPGRFQAALERARAKQAPSGERFEVKLARGGAEVEMEIAEADRLGVLTSETRVTKRPGPADENALVSQSEELIRRVTYLSENLALIELDRSRCRSVLRSATPRMDGDSVHYFEAVLEGGRKATLRRYRYDRASRSRRVVPANLSSETASRLGGDLLDLFASR